MKVEVKSEHLPLSEDARPFCCESCGRQFSTSAYLSQHRRIHTGLKPYICRFCDRKFTQLSHVQQHERIHTGEKPYSCATCMKSFTQMSNLHSHQRQHMKNKPCKCSNCFMAFDVQKDLESHIESKHTLEKYRKILICPMCSKMYNSETYLTKHMEKHEESSSKSTASSQRSLSNFEPATKYRRQSKNGKNPRPQLEQPLVQRGVSQSLSFPTYSGQVKETPVARSVNDISVALDISKSIVTAASGLRLDVFLEGLASSNCPSPLVSAAASVWGHSWFNSSSSPMFEGPQTLRPDRQTGRSMCLDLLSMNKQTQRAHQTLMNDMMSHELMTASTRHSSTITLPTLSQITEKFISSTYADPSVKAPHINTVTTAFQ